MSKAIIGTLALMLFILGACTPGDETSVENSAMIEQEGSGDSMENINESDDVMNDDSMMLDADDTGEQGEMEDDESMTNEEQNDGEMMAPEMVTIELEAKNFEFSQKEISVKKGQTVKIVLKSTQGFHNWKIDEFSAQTANVNSGEMASVEFVADQAGEFEYYCSVGTHRELGMVGKLMVTEN